MNHKDLQTIVRPVKRVSRALLHISFGSPLSLRFGITLPLSVKATTQTSQGDPGYFFLYSLSEFPAQGENQ